MSRVDLLVGDQNVPGLVRWGEHGVWTRSRENGLFEVVIEVGTEGVAVGRKCSGSVGSYGLQEFVVVALADGHVQQVAGDGGVFLKRSDLTTSFSVWESGRMDVSVDVSSLHFLNEVVDVEAFERSSEVRFGKDSLGEDSTARK